MTPSLDWTSLIVTLLLLVLIAVIFRKYLKPFHYVLGVLVLLAAGGYYYNQYLNDIAVKQQISAN